MADITLSPPTKEEIEETTGKEVPLSSIGLNQPESEVGTTQDVEGFTAEKKKVSARDATGYGDFGLFTDFLHGFNEIILALPDAAINAVAEIGERLGVVPEKDIVDRNYLTRIFNAGDYEKVKPLIPYVLSIGLGEKGDLSGDSTLAKFARGMGQGGAFAVPFAGLTSRAANLSAQTPKVIPQTTYESVKKAITDPYLTSPGVTTAIEGTVGALSGGGIALEKELFGTQTGIGGLLPFAPLGLYYGFAKSPIGQASGWLKNKIFETKDNLGVSSGKQDPGAGVKGAQVRKDVEAEIDAAATTATGIKNVEKATEIETLLNPYTQEGPIVYSPAEQTLDASLLATQKRVEQGGTPSFSRINANRKANILTAVKNFWDDNFSGNAVDDGPIWVFDQVNGKYQHLIGKMGNAEKEVANKLEIVSNSNTGVIPKIKKSTGTEVAQEGEAIRTILKTARDRAKKDAETLAKKLRINTADPLSKGTEVVDAQELLKGMFLPKEGVTSISYAGLPKTLKAFMETNFKNGRMSFQDWKTFRDQVSSDIGVAFARGNKQDVRNLTILGETLDKLATTFGKTNENFNTFKTWYSENVVVPFEKGGVTRVLAPNISKELAESGMKYSHYILPGEKVADAFLTDSVSAKHFMQVFENDPLAQKHMKNIILDKIHNQVYNKNKSVLDPDKLNTYINKNGEVLSELGLFEDISNTETLLRSLLKRQESLVNRRKAINSNLLMKTLLRNTQGYNSPDKLLDDALRSPKLMLDLKKAVTREASLKNSVMSSNEATEAFNAAIISRLFPEKTWQDPVAFKSALNKHHKILDMALDKSHVDNMWLLADAIERAIATGIEPGGTGIIPEGAIEKFTQAFGSSPPALATRFVALAERRVGPKSVAAWGLFRALSARTSARADALFREAMFNPTLAKRLVEEQNGVSSGGITEKNKRFINAYLYTLGVDYGESLSEDVSGPIGTETIEFLPNRPDPNQIITEPPPPKKIKKPFEDMPPKKIIPLTPDVIGKTSSLMPNQQSTTDVASLFPNDPTAIAIAKRRSPTGGINTLLG